MKLSPLIDRSFEDDWVKKLTPINWSMFFTGTFRDKKTRNTLDYEKRLNATEGFLWKLCKRLRIRQKKLAYVIKDEVDPTYNNDLKGHVHLLIASEELDRRDIILAENEKSFPEIARTLWKDMYGDAKADYFDQDRAESGIRYIAKQSKGSVFIDTYIEANSRLKTIIKRNCERGQHRPAIASDCDLSGFDAAPPPPPIQTD